MIGSVLAVQTHREGEGQGLSAPRGTDAEGQRDEIEAAVEDGVLAPGAPGITEDSRPLDLPSTPLEEGVVGEEGDSPLRSEEGEETSPTIAVRAGVPVDRPVLEGGRCRWGRSLTAAPRAMVLHIFASRGDYQTAGFHWDPRSPQSRSPTPRSRRAQRVHNSTLDNQRIGNGRGLRTA